MEGIPGGLRRSLGEGSHGAAAVHDVAALDGFALGLGRGRLLALRHLAADQVGTDAEALAGCQGMPRLLADTFVVVQQIAGYRDVAQGVSHWLQPGDGVLGVAGPVAIGDDANGEAAAGGRPNPFDQQWIVQEGLAAFEVDAADRAKLECLIERIFEIGQGEDPGLLRASPHEAMVAREDALIGEQEVQPRQVHVGFPSTPGFRSQTSATLGNRAISVWGRNMAAVKAS